MPPIYDIPDVKKNFLVAAANYAALKDFFTKYPSFKTNPFYLTGESYAGVYIPMLGVKILEGIKDSKINLKGVAIGNGLVSDSINTNTQILYLYNHDSCDIYNIPDNSTCGDMQQNLYTGYDNNLVNPYDLYDDCEPTNKTIAFRRKIKTRNSNLILNNLANKFAQRDRQLYYGAITCTDVSSAEHYLNMPNVKEALHIPSNLNIKWEECSDDVFNNYTSTTTIEMANFTKIILNANIRMLFYYGDLDVVCNFLLGQRFTEQLGFKVKNVKYPWIVNGQIGGYATEYVNGLTFTSDKNKILNKMLYSVDIFTLFLTSFYILFINQINLSTAFSDKSICGLAKDRGNSECGSISEKRFYFDLITKRCQPFLYQAKCEGNVRAAVDSEARVIKCPSDQCPDNYECSEKIVCNVEYDTGRYAFQGSHTPRFFYKKEVNNCLLFTYYGALGNANNFE
uniref:Carboxypeptidase n=1 Tax=Meloidogyne floridensis TaxID=298350 RepID=A0A915P7H0_9BILA